VPINSAIRRSRSASCFSHWFMGTVYEIPLKTPRPVFQNGELHSAVRSAIPKDRIKSVLPNACWLLSQSCTNIVSGNLKVFYLFYEPFGVSSQNRLPDSSDILITLDEYYTIYQFLKGCCESNNPATRKRLYHNRRLGIREPTAHMRHKPRLSTGVSERTALRHRGYVDGFCIHSKILSNGGASGGFRSS
jgi:hypothetical protein